MVLCTPMFREAFSRPKRWKQSTCPLMDKLWYIHTYTGILFSLKKTFRHMLWHGWTLKTSWNKPVTEGQMLYDSTLYEMPGDLPHPGIEPRSPTLQADPLLSEPPGKPNPIWLVPLQKGEMETETLTEGRWGKGTWEEDSHLTTD